MLVLAVVYPAFSATVAFRDGEVKEGVIIMSRTDSYIELKLDEGTVRFPISTIKSIDGNAIVLPSTAAPTATPDSSLWQSAPVPAEAPAPGVAAPPAEENPASPPVDQPVVAEASPPVDASMPAADAAVAEAQSVAPASSAYRWHYEGVLLGLLLLAGVWMRSVQWVQKDIFDRRLDPRIWTLVAVVLPGLGALVYAAVTSIGDMIQRRSAGRATTDSTPPPVMEETPDAAPARRPWYAFFRDPAAHLASKGRTRRGFEFLDTERKSIRTKSGDDASSGLDHAQEMLEEALLEHASDVHIEPTAEDYRVRFRLDGILHERMTYDEDTGRRLVTALKTLAGIDIAEKRKAQDGRFRVRTDDREVDFRVATANSIHGEKMVIRILDHRGGIIDLTSLGMSDDMLATFQSVIQSRNGMILATGPTGAGKTSTLYAALRQLDASRLNIMTIEDPPEYELTGSTQLAVNPRAGITYESGLRSILRQDPDVILVGEMRDTEAAEVALRAALTGHLVLSSLHTKNAVGTIARLQDMGIERYQVASGLLMVIAQRLVRVLCPECRQPYAAEGNELESLGFNFEPGSTLYAPGSCDHCLGTGFKGRTGLFELLVLDEEVRRLIGEGIDEASLESLLVERGFRSYRYDGAEKILMGITTVDEVLQAT